ncbi:MAG: DUF5908 family protein [Saprospiraceae bacterium]|jgi:hypothetical protein|nr:DUF5908 family protein [Saprospiraceae bacterium]MDP5047375.1 DUF5908 family protein [Saprospiraceae bacterium]
MPVEIRQLVVKANVKDTDTGPTPNQGVNKSQGKKSKDTLGFYEKEELINEVVSRVMEQIKTQTNQ